MRKTRRGRRRGRLAAFRRFARRRGKEVRAFLRAWWKSPPAMRWVVGTALLIVCWFTANWLYHAVNKPSEVFFPLDGALDKDLTETWREYGSLFREHSTAVITPELLAALAQVESTGNPLARTYWRWQFTLNPFGMYRPASSAVGMYQITDGTFRLARRYCIHDHVVVEAGRWNDWRSCWFNSLYTRILPSHAIEMTAALLDRHVAEATGTRAASATLKQKQDLAAVIHLCGAGAGQAFVRRGFRLVPGQRCGDHDTASYLAKVNAMKRRFALLAAGSRLERLAPSR